MKTGDIVEWTSSANGATRTKRGEIVEVVAEGLPPSRMDPDAYFSVRDHESYVVSAVTLRDGKPHGAKRLYWPRVSQLKEIGKAAT